MYTKTPLTTLEQKSDRYAQACREARELRRAAITAFWDQVFCVGTRALRAAWPKQKARTCPGTRSAPNLTGA